MNYIIFGGTGTLGKALAKIASRERRHVVIVSRDELKQQEMRRDFPQFDYVLGDISQTHWQQDIPKIKYECAFNLAAVKHVDVAEINVAHAMRVNTIGTINTAQWAEEQSVNSYALSSTDKSILPINAYGYTKGLAEKFVRSMALKKSRTKFHVFRWANVLGSRGSVLCSFVKSLQERGEVDITSDKMTRFWVHIDDVAEFMWINKTAPVRSEAFIPEMKASKVIDLARAVAHELGIGDDFKVNHIGIRPGEKIHECIRTGHDYCVTSENCEQYTFAELRALVARSLK